MAYHIFLVSTLVREIEVKWRRAFTQSDSNQIFRRNDMT